MTNMQESFQDSINSLELTKDKMQNMVPSEVHVALKNRYQQVRPGRISLASYVACYPGLLVLVPQVTWHMHRCFKNCLKCERRQTRKVSLASPTKRPTPSKIVLTVVTHPSKMHAYRFCMPTSNDVPPADITLPRLFADPTSHKQWYLLRQLEGVREGRGRECAR